MTEKFRDMENKARRRFQKEIIEKWEKTSEGKLQRTV